MRQKIACIRKNIAPLYIIHADTITLFQIRIVKACLPGNNHIGNSRDAQLQAQIQNIAAGKRQRHKLHDLKYSRNCHIRFNTPVFLLRRNINRALIRQKIPGRHTGKLQNINQAQIRPARRRIFYKHRKKKITDAPRQQHDTGNSPVHPFVKIHQLPDFLPVIFCQFLI